MAKYTIEDTTLSNLFENARKYFKDNAINTLEKLINALVAKPAEFTNVLAYADSLEINKRFSSNGGVNTNQPNSIIAVTIDLNKLPDPQILQKNTNEFRFRGCAHPDGAFAQSSDGVTYSSKGFNTHCTEIDENGDMVFTRGYISERYVRFNIGMATYPTSSNPALPDDFDPVAAGCIVTFNEAINL